MNGTRCLKALLFALLFSMWPAGVQAQAPAQPEAWMQVDSLEQAGHPRSAAVLVDSLYREAQAAGAQPQLIKALIHRAKYAVLLQEHAADSVASDLRHALQSTDPPAQSVLHSVMAELYWNYFNSHRRLSERQTLAEGSHDESDLKTWGPRRILAAAARHYRHSVTPRRVLEQVPLARYEALLTAPASKTLRPTLYDLLAYRALDFWASDAAARLTPEHRLTLPPKPDYFAPANRFVRLAVPETQDTLAPAPQALRLFQRLLALHASRADSAALLDADLRRLRFAHAHAAARLDADSLYVHALRRIRKRFRDVPHVTAATHALAQQYYARGKEDSSDAWQTAHRLCGEAINRYPKTHGADECRALHARIERKRLSFQLPGAILPEKPTLARVSYRNVDSLHVKVVRSSAEELRRYRHLRREKQRRVLRRLARRGAAEEFTLKLPATSDFRQHATELAVPPLEEGIYAVLVSAADFSVDLDTALRRQAVGHAFVQATPLSYVARERGERYAVRVVHRASGAPLDGAEVTFRPERGGTRTLTTDRHGHASLPARKLQDDFALTIRHHGHRLIEPEKRFYYRDRRRRRQRLTTRFFTDRSIYRPGQTIHFKGIVMETNGERHEIAPDREITVYFFDTNGQKIDSLAATTNEYGSVSGQFRAPQGVLNGRMTIRATHGEERIGSTGVRVEEYKRPRFEVTLREPQGQSIVGDTVTVRGQATSYAGASLDDADVSYRVTRVPRWAPWRHTHYGGLPRREKVEISRGTVETKPDGRFTVRFQARPDPAIPASTAPIYRYRVEVDVADVTGETHSAETSVQVGYATLRLHLDAPRHLNKTGRRALPLRATNLNDQPQPAEGRLLALRLKPPEHYFRQERWPEGDQHVMSRADFRAMFPHDAYAAGEDDMSNWRVADTVAVRSFQTDTTEAQASVRLPALERWPSGAYRLELHARDAQDHPVETRAYTAVFSPEERRLPYPMADWFVPLKAEGEPGEEAAFLVGSSAENVHLFFEVEHEGNITERRHLRLSGEQQRVTVPIEEKHRGNFAVHAVFVKDNRAYSHNAVVEVPYSNRRLDLSLSTFRSTLRPGQEEKWTLTARGPDGEAATAELVAAMYDASLDDIISHDWRFGILRRMHRPQLRWRTDNLHGDARLRLRKRSWRATPEVPAPLLPRLNLFGLRSFDRAELMIGQPSSYYLVEERDDRVVTGRVRSAENDRPLPGANVVVRGTQLSTATGQDGRFRLTLPGDSAHVLRFSFVGYRTLDASVEGGAELVVSLGSTERGEALTISNDMASGVQQRQGAEFQQTANAPPPASGNLDLDTTLDMGQPTREPAQAQAPPPAPGERDEPASGLAEVEARRDLRETAFFFPHLRTNAGGETSFTFTTPEALTRWKMMAFGHTKDLKYGQLRGTAVTQKKLMVTPHAPRFFRARDTLRFTAKVDNLADTLLAGTAQLMLFDAATMQPIDRRLGNTDATRAFRIQRGASQSLRWRLTIPEGLSTVTYRVVAKANRFSDGEEDVAPVLPSELLFTESQPLQVEGNETERFTFDKLLASTNRTLRHHRLTLEFTPNPVWYAVQALPYLAEFPHDCAEQIFSRYYANRLALHIVEENPRIETVYRQWKESEGDALQSNLEKNPELKALMLDATPWVMEAHSESAQKRRIAQLFDTRRVRAELSTALRRLRELQRPDGAWPWFSGGDPNRYVTQYIVAGLAHLAQLGALNLRDDPRLTHMLARAVGYLDQQIRRDYETRLDQHADTTGRAFLGRLQIQYLYARSYFPDVLRPSAQKRFKRHWRRSTRNRAHADRTEKAFDFYLRQARRHWLSQNKYRQGLIALALHREGDATTAREILASLEEFALRSEKGMYWKRPGRHPSYRTPIERQALFIEAFREITGKQAPLDAMKQWLLRQKQTQDWGTTKATARAVHALLLRGTDLLAQRSEAAIRVGDRSVDTRAAETEAGTGYVKTTWPAAEVKPSMGRITVQKTGDGLAWGALYWQYFEQIDEVSSAETGALALEKRRFRRVVTDEGPVLHPITSDTTALQPGDRLVVRLVLRANRDLEYVHLKDLRASGLEPTHVLSRHRYQDGLRYYESTRDAATHFFFDRLPKGTYVFEYPLRVAHTGDFAGGLATIQCMYAPEFTAHSSGKRLRVGRRE